MKHRKSHFSLSLKILSILSCVAILAVGFANWLIIQTKNVSTTEGSFEVYDVTSKKITVTPGNNGKYLSVDKIVFGKPATTNNTVWLVPQGTMSTDALSTNLKFTVGIDSDTTTALNTLISNVTVTIKISATQAEKLEDAIDAGYVATPVLKVGDNTVATYDANTDSFTYTVNTTSANTLVVDANLVFAWGTVTGGANPYTFYNGKTAGDFVNGTSGDTWADQAEDLLKGVFAFNGGNYTITISETVAAQ